jgi:predicted secreted protein
VFADARSKKLILIAHCVLNQNSLSDGTADYPASNKELVDLLLQSRVGIVQMPCPELHCLGLDRGNVHGSEQPVVENTRIRKSMNRRFVVRILKSLVRQIVYQIEQYRRYGFVVCGIVGIDRSPSCGVNTTSIRNREVRGEGVFIEALHKELKKRHIHIEMVGIKALDVKEAIVSIGRLLHNAQ